MGETEKFSGNGSSEEFYKIQPDYAATEKMKIEDAPLEPEFQDLLKSISEVLQQEGYEVSSGPEYRVSTTNGDPILVSAYKIKLPDPEPVGYLLTEQDKNGRIIGEASVTIYNYGQRSSVSKDFNTGIRGIGLLRPLTEVCEKVLQHEANVRGHKIEAPLLDANKLGVELAQREYLDSPTEENLKNLQDKIEEHRRWEQGFSKIPLEYNPQTKDQEIPLDTSNPEELIRKLTKDV